MHPSATLHSHFHCHFISFVSKSRFSLRLCFLKLMLLGCCYRFSKLLHNRSNGAAIDDDYFMASPSMEGAESGAQIKSQSPGE